MKRRPTPELTRRTSFQVHGRCRVGLICQRFLTAEEWKTRTSLMKETKRIATMSNANSSSSHGPHSSAIETLHHAEAGDELSAERDHILRRFLRVLARTEIKREIGATMLNILDRTWKASSNEADLDAKASSR